MANNVDERIYCSRLAEENSAPLYGTAVQVDLWLLLEYPRPWRPRALLDNELSAAVNAHLGDLPQQVAAASGKTLRVQFIKQASSADVGQPRLFLADGNAAQPRLVAGELKNYAAIAELGAADLLDFRLPGGRSVDESIYLVCTNGQRDLCCARFGLPLFETLRIEFDSRIWQTTHIGGHRYAPNLVCLPSGIVYGFVRPEQGVAVVQASDRGQLSLDHLRGRAAYPPAVQAAEYFLRSALTLQADAGLRLQELTEAGDTFRVTFADTRGERHRLQLRESLTAEAVLASCDAEPKPVKQFQIVAFS